MSAATFPARTIGLASGESVTFSHNGHHWSGSRRYKYRTTHGRTEWTVATGTAFTLGGLLRMLWNVQAANEAVREVLDYVHSTEWGADLK
jgi:hypothetical protein